MAQHVGVSFSPQRAIRYIPKPSHSMVGDLFYDDAEIAAFKEDALLDVMLANMAGPEEELVEPQPQQRTRQREHRDSRQKGVAPNLNLQQAMSVPRNSNRRTSGSAPKRSSGTVGLKSPGRAHSRVAPFHVLLDRQRSLDDLDDLDSKPASQRRGSRSLSPKRPPASPRRASKNGVPSSPPPRPTHLLEESRTPSVRERRSSSGARPVSRSSPRMNRKMALVVPTL